MSVRDWRAPLRATVTLATLLILLAAVARVLLPPTPAAQPAIAAAQAQLNQAQRYTIQSTITQHLTPLARPEMVGQGDVQLTFAIDGTISPRGESRYVFRNTGDPSAPPAVLIADQGQLFLEQAGQRAPAGGVAGVTPSLSPLDYLAAADQVQLAEPAMEGGTSYTRYTFQIDGRRFLARMAAQQGAAAAQTALSALLQDMAGDGEIWLRADGAPARQILRLQIPAIEQRYSASILVETTISGLEHPTPPASPLVGIVDAISPLRELVISLPSLLLAGLLAGVMALQLCLRRRWHLTSRLIAAGVSAILIAAPVLLPGRATALAAPQAALTQAIGQPQLVSPPAALGAPVAQSAPLATPTQGSRCGDGAAGADTDSDGISDQQEQCLGTDPFRADTDSDGIGDGAEVDGFTFAGQQWPTDPLSPDSNRDGQLDTAEWPAPAGAARSADLDSDGAPNAWDRDDDGDSVPDSIDISPEARTTQIPTFTISTSGDGYTGHQYIEIHVRTQNPDRMRYTATALDWPYDTEGQIQDHDSSREDLRLVPVLEVTASQAPDPALASRYNVTIVQRDGKTLLYLPLSPLSEGGQISALSARLAYGPGQNASVRLEARMVWMLNGALDQQTYSGLIVGQPTIVHTYPEPTFQVTGLQISLSRDVESAIIAAPDEADDRALFQLLYGWQAAVLNAERLDGQSALRTTLAEAIFRLTAANTPVEQRFGIPSGARISADLQRYSHLDEALADLNGRRITAFLAAEGYQATDRPALALAHQEESGSYGLDEVGQLDPGASLTVGLSAIHRQIVRGVRLALYRNDGGWRQSSPDEMLEDGATRDIAPALAALQARYPRLSAADLRSLLSMLYFSWGQGSQRLISSDGAAQQPAMRPNAEIAARVSNSEASLPAYLVELLQLGEPSGGLRIGGSLAAEYSYERATDDALGLSIPGVDRDAFRMLRSSTIIAGTEIPIVSVRGGLAVYKVYKAAAVLKHFVTDGKKFSSWFQANKSWAKLSKGSKALKGGGAVLSIGMAWTEFGMTTDFSNPKAVGAAVTLAIVSTAIAVALFVVSLNPVGAVLTAILAVIDLILFFATGDTLTDRISRAVAEFFYDYNILTQLDRADFKDIDSRFSDEGGGVVVGNRFIVSSTFQGVVSTTSDGGDRDLERSFVHGSFTPNSKPGSQIAPANGAMTCTTNADYTVKTCTNPVGAEYLLIAPRVNALISFTGWVRSVTYTEECILGICDDSREVDDLPESPQATELYLDVLPSDIDSLWGWSALTNLDMDGDGVTSGREGQLGTSTSAWDTDGDGLSDGYELEIATSPLQADSDSDGLSDAAEIQYGTSPLQADSDSDGLADGLEIRRFEGGQWRGGWDVGLPGGRTVAIFSAPGLGDADGDGLSDAAERASGTSPAAANLGPLLDLRAIPVVADPDSRVGVIGEPGDQLRIDMALINGGAASISSTLELCIPALLTGLSGGGLYGARRPAAQVGACAAGQRYAWPLSGADALRVGEIVTTTLTAQIDPALAASASGQITAQIAYLGGAEEGGATATRSARQVIAAAVDMDSPIVTLGGAEDGALLRGASLVLGGSASDPTSWVTGVEISVNGGTSYQPVARFAEHAWAYTWALPADGTYTLIARATDQVGRTATSAPITVRVDNTAPAAATSIANGAVLRPSAGGEVVALSGSATDNLAGLVAVQISIDGKPWRDVALANPGAPSSAWSYDWQLPGGAAAQGQHTIALRARDRVGNTSADGAAVRSVVVDVAPPTDDLTSSDYLAPAPPSVQVGAPTTLTGRADDTGNAPRPARPQPLSGSVDALQGATVWLMPDAAAELSAASRATWLGDLNGDGRGDLAVGLPAGAGGAGRVVVVYGRGGDWPAIPNVEALASSGSSFIGAPGAAVGGMVSPAGDTNADGYNDLLIGDPAAGVAYLMLGRSGGFGRDIPLNGGEASGRVLIASPSLQLVAPAGDVNGDGADDLLVGTGGQLLLLLGRVGVWPAMVDPATEAAAALSLPAAGVATGVGDVDGDGRDDIAVGDPNSGALQVYAGRADLARGTLVALSAGPSYSGFGGQAQIAALGRVDSGARSDFAYTTSGAAQLVLDGGGASALTYTGAVAGLLAAPGDVNADGAADILLGVPGDQSALLISGASRTTLATLTGVAGAASAPYAAGADLNCDTSSDLLLIPSAAPADAPPESERVLDPASFIAPSRLPGASVTTVQPAPAPASGVRLVDDDYCIACDNDGLAWGVTAFSTIQSAIDAAGPLTTILVRPGVYGAFSIGSTRSGLAVVGANPDSVIIDAAGGAYAAQVSGATGVRISAMTLRNATRAVSLSSAGVGGATNSALRTTLDRLAIYGFTNAVRMTRDSTVDLMRSTIAGDNSSGSAISVDSTPDSGAIPSWGAAPISNVNVPMTTGAHLFSEGSDLFAVTGTSGGEIRQYRPSPLNIWGSRVSGLPFGARGAGAGDGSVYWVYGFLPTPGSVRAIAVDGSSTYIAGEFSYVEQNGAAVNISSIARWDGSSWSALGGGPNTPGERIAAMAVMGGSLYVATTPIASSYGGPCCGVFRWDNPGWTRILQSVSVSTSTGDPYARILTMTTDGTRLYVAGNFDYYDATGAGNLFMGQSGVLVWNGSSWSNISSTSTFRPIPAVAVDSATGDVYASSTDGYVYRAPSGGSFNTTPILSLFQSGGGTATTSLLWYSGDLYVGGRFNSASGFSGTFNNILRYNRNPTTFVTTVSPLGSGTDTTVHALARNGSLIYATGNFTTVDGAAANDLAAWNGSAWTTFAGDVGATAGGITRPIAITSGGDVLIGGDFQGISGDSKVYDIARYSAGAWRPLDNAARGVTTETPPTMTRFVTPSSQARTLTWADITAGSAFAGDGAGGLYLLKGTGGEFYRYSTAADTWQRRAPLPASAALGTAMTSAGGQIYVAVGGGLSMYRYSPADNSWSPLASAPAAMGTFGAGAGLVWDGRDYLYATNGGNGNQYARYALATGTWESLGAMPFQIGDGGSLARVGSTIYASLGNASGVTGDLRQLSPVGLIPNKLRVTDSAFIADASVAAPDWIDLDASTEDFAYSETGSQWTQAGGQSWAAPGAGATIPLTSARLIDQANDVYRVDQGSALTAGYAAAHPDAHVSPLYCATCANDGYQWGETAFSSIQAAIDSGAPRVLLGPGLFREAISLVSGVQVIGAGADLSVIEPPSGTVRAVVTAEGVRGATLARVTVAGGGTTAGSPLGVVVEQGAQQVRIARSIIRNAPIGIQVNDATTALEIVNATIVANASGVQVNGAGSAGRVDMRNTLLASNSGTALTYTGSTVLHRYNGYYQNGVDISTGIPGLGDVASDPFFVDAAILDFRLRDGSPMINAGSPNDPTPPGTSGRVDIGYIQRGQAAFYADATYGPNSFNDGLDWQVDAFATIQGALDAAERSLRAIGCRAASDGTCAYQLTVGVGPGTYVEQLRVPSQVRLVGSGAELTTVNGGSGSAISFTSVVNAGLSGLTITGTSGGVGVSVDGASNTISVRRAIIRGLGAGVRFSGASSGEVTFTTLVGNGTAIWADSAGSWARAEHSILSSNTTGLTGAGGGTIFSAFNLIHQSPGGASGVVSGDGIISGQSPLFVNAAANNYRLQAGSPALDVGAPWADPPAGGGVRADLGYAELIARPLTLLLGREGVSCAAGNSGVQQTEVGIVLVADQTLPVTATLPLTWASATMAQPGGAYSYWTASVTPPVAGYYRIYTRAIDVAGNQEGDAQVLYSGALIADGTAPTVTWVSATPISSSAAAIELIATSDDGAAADLAFEVDNGTTTYQIAAGWSSTAWAGGSRQFRAVASLPAGSYTIVAIARDAAGNEGRSAQRSATISSPASHTITFITPQSGGFTNQSTLTLHGYVRFAAVIGTGAVDVSVGGVTVAATLADPTALVSAWSATVDLGSPGAKAITATPRNAGGAGTPEVLSITLDQTPPSVTLPGSTPLVTSSVSLSGSASDSQSGLASVDVSFDGGFLWLPATLVGANWSVSWSAPTSPQNVRYPVRVRARDLAQNETISALVLTVDTSAPTIGELSFNIEPETHVDTPPAATLVTTWTPATDDGGLVTLYASYDQLPTSVPNSVAGGNSLSQPLNASGAWYLHLRAVDAAGNSSIRHVGPWYVRDVGSCAVLPLAIDGQIDLESGEWRADRNLIDDDERPDAPQSLYAALDVDSLFLGWRGARWAVDGTLYLYLSTGAAGTVAPAVTIPGVAALPFAADLAIVVTSPTEASAWRYTGGAWQAQSLTPAQLTFAQGEGGDTEIRLSRSLVGSMANAIAFAADETGAPWSVFPTSNPLSGSWGASYSWAGVADCTTPMGGGQPSATSLDLTVTPQQDPALPLGPGASVVHTLRLQNHEARTVSGAELRLSATSGLTYQSIAGVSCAGCAPGLSAWSVSLPPLAPGSSTTITITGRLDAALGALQTVTSTAEIALGGAPIAVAPQAQRVDGLAPTVDLPLAPGSALLPGLQSLAGSASDGDGAGVQSVEVRPQGGGWQPATGTLSWRADLTAPVQQTWTVEVRATDRNGLTSAPQTYSFSVDEDAPTATMALPGLLAGSTAVITGTTSDPAPAGAQVAGVEVQIGDATAAWLPAQVYDPSIAGEQSWAYTWVLPDVDNQPYQLRARAIDAAGNVGAPTAWGSTMVDSRAPTITTTLELTSINLATYPETAILGGQITDGSGVASLQMRIFSPTGDSYVEPVAQSGASWSYTPQRLLTAGGYRLLLESSDTAGNAGEREFLVGVTGQAPPQLTVAITRLDPEITSATSVRFAVTFNMTVTGIVTPNLTLAPSGISGATIDSIIGAGAAYTVTVGTGSGDGTLGLDMVSSSGVENIVLKPVTNLPHAGERYTIDKTRPVASIDTVLPSLRNTAVPSATIRFSAPVSGLDLSDLALTRDGAPVPLTGATIQPDGPASFVLGNLASATSAEGDYQITLTALGSGIADSAGNLLSGDATASFTVDTTAPTALIDAVMPDPRNTSVVSMTIRLSEPVVGLGVEDLTLTRDGGANLLTGAETLTSADQQTWVLTGIATLTSAEGSYALGLTPPGATLADLAGNSLVAPASASFVVDTTAPVLLAIDRLDPPLTNAASVRFQLTFSEQVATLTAAHLSLDAAGVSGASISSVAGAGTTWVVTATTGAGNGTLGLRLIGSIGLSDRASNPVVDFSTTGAPYTIDRTALFAAIDPVSPNPRRSALATITIRFPRPVVGLDLGDLTLARDGGANLLTGAETLTSADQQTWALSGIAPLTGAEGIYQLTIRAAGSGVADGAGNPLAADATGSFRVDLTAPTVSVDPVTPNPRSSSVEQMTIRFSEPVVGLTLGDLTLTRDGAPVSLAGATLRPDATGEAWVLGGMARITWLTGRYLLTVTAGGSAITDEAGNPLAAGASGGFHFNQVIVFLPMVMGEPSGPDLIATVRFSPDRRSFRADEPVTITVEVTNRGDLPASPFWVDLMLNPSPIPTGPALWNNTCTLNPCRGLSWYVGRALAPGETVVLTSTPDSYAPSDSLWSEYLHPGTRSVYVVVDSWNGAVPYGAVRESNETNNIVAITDIMVSGGGSAAPAPQQQRVMRARPTP